MEHTKAMRIVLPYDIYTTSSLILPIRNTKHLVLHHFFLLTAIAVVLSLLLVLLLFFLLILFNFVVHVADLLRIPFSRLYDALAMCMPADWNCLLLYSLIHG